MEIELVRRHRAYQTPQLRGFHWCRTTKSTKMSANKPIRDRTDANLKFVVVRFLDQSPLTTGSSKDAFNFHVSETSERCSWRQMVVTNLPQSLVLIAMMEIYFWRDRDSAYSTTHKHKKYQSVITKFSELCMEVRIKHSEELLRVRIEIS